MASKVISRITLFTRQNCSLCETAHRAVQNVQSRRPFRLDTIDVMSAGQNQWKDVYEFDTPVIHVEKVEHRGIVDATQKLMHRFTEAQVEQLLDNVENNDK